MELHHFNDMTMLSLKAKMLPVSFLNKKLMHSLCCLASFIFLVHGSDVGWLSKCLDGAAVLHSLVILRLRMKNVTPFCVMPGLQISVSILGFLFKARGFDGS